MLKIKVFSANPNKLEKITNEWLAQNPSIDIRYQKFDDTMFLIMYEE